MNISFEDFKKCEMRIGTIVVAELVEGSEKLLRLEVDFGEDVGKRQILSGIAKFYTPEEMLGKQLPFIVNLEPRKMMGLESQGMLIAADNNGPVLLFPNREVVEGVSLI
jgi:methionine--tRNA ligase beta chain